MKKIFLWISGFILGIIVFIIGQAIMLFIDQLFFNYLNFWLASLLSVPFSILSTYKITGYAFFAVPYILLKNESMTLYYVFCCLIFAFLLSSLYNNQIFENLSSIPKWLYILIQIFYIFGIIGLIKNLKAYQMRLRITKDVDREINEMAYRSLNPE